MQRKYTGVMTSRLPSQHESTMNEQPQVSRHAWLPNLMLTGFTLVMVSINGCGQDPGPPEQETSKPVANEVPKVAALPPPPVLEPDTGDTAAPLPAGMTITCVTAKPDFNVFIPGNDIGLTVSGTGITNGAHRLSVRIVDAFFQTIKETKLNVTVQNG